MQRSDHRSELRDARTAVRVHCVRALGREEVERVVAPVEAVGVADAVDARLLLGRCRPERRQVARRHGLRGAVLLDRRDVERRQQVHGVDPGVRELGELRHAGAFGVGERLVRTALILGNGLVGDREVADVQLVDRAVDRLVDHRRFRLLPRLRLVRLVAQVDRDRALGVQRQRDRVGVRDGVRLDRSGGRRVDDDLPEVLVTLEVALARDRPGSGCGIPCRLVALRFAGCGSIPGQQRRGLGGRSPEAERGLVALPADAELHVGQGRGVEVVEHAGDLHAGEAGEGVAAPAARPPAAP